MRRQRLGALDDVAHALRLDGVEREEARHHRGGQGRRRHAAGAERPPRQQEGQAGRGQVDEQVDEVVAGGSEAAGAVVQGEREAGERSPGKRPGLGVREPLQGLDGRVSLDERLVVELELAVQRAGVCERAERQHGGEQIGHEDALGNRPVGHSRRQ